MVNMPNKTPINKKTLDNLAKLARLEIKKEDEKKFLGDLKKIVKYFDDIKAVDTEGVEAVSGGTDLKNVLRNDKYDKSKRLLAKHAVEAFPDEKNGFLKAPPIFEK